jgi:Siphovirus Gp157
MNAYALKLEAQAHLPLAEALRRFGEDDDGIQCALESETDATEMLRETLRRTLESEAHAEALKETQRKLRERAERLSEAGQSGRRAIQAFMETIGLKTLRLPEATVSIGHGQPNVVITDEVLVPVSYRKADPRIEQAYEQLLRASAYAAANGHEEMHADFHHTAQALLAHFTLDRKALATALKEGVTVPGAALGNGATWLVVRS